MEASSIWKDLKRCHHPDDRSLNRVLLPQETDVPRKALKHDLSRHASSAKLKQMLEAFEKLSDYTTHLMAHEIKLRDDVVASRPGCGSGGDRRRPLAETRDVRHGDSRRRYR